MPTVLVDTAAWMEPDGLYKHDRLAKGRHCSGVYLGPPFRAGGIHQAIVMRKRSNKREMKARTYVLEKQQETLDFDACSAVTEIAIESTIANAFNQIAENSLSDPRPKQPLYFIAA